MDARIALLDYQGENGQQYRLFLEVEKTADSTYRVEARGYHMCEAPPEVKPPYSDPFFLIWKITGKK